MNKKRANFIFYLVVMFLSGYGLWIMESKLRVKLPTSNQQPTIHNPVTTSVAKQLQPKSMNGEYGEKKILTLKTDTDTNKEISLLPKFEKAPEKKNIPFVEDKVSYLVIIVDDLGENTAGTDEILSLNYPLTLSIIPHLSHSRQIAEEAHRRGFEVIVHLPLEAEDERYNKKNNPITVDMCEDEIQEKTKDAFASIPNATGFNNHQGSKFTTSISALRNVLKVAKENNFFYIDSLTSPYSAGELVARGVGVKFGKRDVFLDNIKEKNYIKEQFRQLVRVAKRKGKAIGICHVSLVTYEVLKEELPRLSEQNVKLVFASEIVE